MSDVERFALIMLITAAAVMAAVLANRVSDRIRIPAPAIFLLAAAVYTLSLHDALPISDRKSVV